MNTLSVVIPTRNQSFSLDLTLHWLTRTLPDQSEVIVVDDGSTEDINKIITKYIKKLPLIFIRQEGRGRSSARNLGVRVANGDRILFNDSDRFPALTDLTVHRDGKGIVIGKVKEFYFSKPIQMKYQIKHEIESLLPRARMPQYPKLMRKYLFNNNGLAITSIPWISFLSGHISVPRKVLLEVGGFDENIDKWGLEHFDLGYRLCSIGVPFSSTDLAINYHIAHSRPKEFFTSHFAESFLYLKSKFNDPVIPALEQFMLGNKSLQHVELASSEPANWVKRTNTPIMFKGLS